MPRPPEPRWPRVVLGYLVFTAIIGGVAAPIYTFVDSPYRPAVVRLAAAAVLGVVLMNVHGRLRGGFAGSATSPFEAARQAVPLAPRFGRRFEERREQVRLGIARDRYFVHVLWPVLRDLTSARTPTRAVARPPGRRFGRGPSADAIAGLLTIIEEDR
jgi:hypothetical protein